MGCGGSKDDPRHKAEAETRPPAAEQMEELVDFAEPASIHGAEMGVQDQAERYEKDLAVGPTLWVRVMRPKPFQVEVPASQTAGYLLNKAMFKLGVQSCMAHVLRLTFCDDDVDPAATLESLGICEDAEVAIEGIDDLVQGEVYLATGAGQDRVNGVYTAVIICIESYLQLVNVGGDTTGLCRRRSCSMA
eukprot:TRINITY_DN7333_c0_g1_i3.p1 TRINITY_DN7333_c0_g1~~TRINITY_DN7333_c0_g1_i3.p1  ORF type:complete len:190 (+),score=44.45 TRINITY_DN7333_c0_g1_i3:197-766(+)